MYKTPLPFLGGGLGSVSSNKSKKEKEKEEKEEKQEGFKGIRAGNLQRKIDKLEEDIASRGSTRGTVEEEDRLETLKSRAMSASARQEKRDERYAESKARTDLKRQSYINKMVKKGIMTAEQAEGHFNNIKGITANSAKLAAELSNQKTKPEKIEEKTSDIASDSMPTTEQLAQINQVSESTSIGKGLVPGQMRGFGFG